MFQARRIISSGRSAAVVIPRPFLRALGLSRGDLLALRVVGGTIVAVPLRERAVFDAGARAAQLGAGDGQG